MALGRWQRIKHALGLSWREPKDCSHPLNRRSPGAAIALFSADDIMCEDCGVTLFLGYPLWVPTDEGRRAER